MEVQVQGTKGGYKILYKTSGFPSSFAIDLRREDVQNNRDTVGSKSYSLGFVSNGCVFSECIGIWDEERKAIGNIMFSVFISNGYHLKGDSIIKLLDEIGGFYEKEYLLDGNLTSQKEDWGFIEEIANRYKAKMTRISSDEVEGYSAAKGDPGFVFYKDEQELQKFFEQPFQEEYSVFKQVFFIDGRFQGKPENPLNALRHDKSANLTGKIDFENPKYRLHLNQDGPGGMKIEVKVNGQKKYNKDRIRRKNELVITWSKPFHEPVEKRVKMTDFNYEFLDIDNGSLRLSVRPIKLKAQTKDYTIEVYDGKSNRILDAEIILKRKGMSDDKLTLLNDKIEIPLEYLESRCSIMARRGKAISKEEVLNSSHSEGCILLTRHELQIQ